LKLLHVERTAVQYPSIKATIRLAKPLVDQVNDVLVRNDSILCDVAFEASSVVIIVVAAHDLSYKLLDLDVYDLVLFGDLKSELLLL